MTSVVITDVGGDPAMRPLALGLAHRLRRIGVEVAVCDGAGTGSEGTTRVAGAVRHALGSGAGRPDLVLFGDETRQRRQVWGLALSGLLPRVRLVVHAGAARIPYEPSSAEVFARAEVIVTESQVGGRAVRQCCAEAGEPAPRVVVTPPPFPPRPDLPRPAPADRRALRRARMGVADDAPVVGCWTLEADDLASQMAMRIFEQFTHGLYWRCDACGHVTAWSVDDHLRPVPCEQCERCGSRDGAAGRVRDDTRLVLVGESAGGDHDWGVQEAREQLGLADRVVQATEESAGDLARLWSCVDIHLQPHVLADVPAPIRASCVLGVPVVATRYGAVEEWLAGAARLVPPRMVVDHSAGHRMALMDPGGALVELCRLADDRAAHQLTAAGQRELAHRWETGALLDRWIELLDVSVANSSEVPCSTW